MKTIFLYLLLILIPSIQLLGQGSYIIKETVLGGDSVERYPMIVKSDSGAFIVAGQSISDVSFDKTEPLCNGSTVQDLWILKINADLIPIWNRSIGGEQTDVFKSIFHDTLTRTFVLGSSSNSDSSCEKSFNIQGGSNSQNYDYWITNMDSAGQITRDFNWGSASGDRYPHCIRLSDGNYLAAGKTTAGISGDKTSIGFGGYDYWLVMFDSLGNKKWDQSYGGSGQEYDDGVGSGSFIIEVDSGQFYLFGTTISPASGNITTGNIGGFTNVDIIVWLIDTGGTIIWQNRYGGIDAEYVNHVLKTSDSGLLVTGSTKSPAGYDVSQPLIGFTDCWIVKLNAQGNIQWERRYGGIGMDLCNCAEPAPGGGYFIGGYTSSPAGYDISEPGYGASDYWIFLIDSIGNKIWDKRYGGPGVNILRNFIVLPDTSIILSGYSDYGSSPVKANPGYGSSDYWLVHLKYTDTLTTVKEQWAYQQVHLSPNPSSGALQIPEFLRDASVTISDVTGRGIVEMPVPEPATLDLSYLPNGCYHFRFATKFGNYYAKWIKM